MSLVRTAKYFKSIIKSAGDEIYNSLNAAHQAAVVAAKDLYDDHTPEESAAAQSIVKSLAILIDRVYRKGISASELKFAVDKVKDIVFNVSVKYPDLSKDLSAVLSILQKVAIVDIAPKMQSHEDSSWMPNFGEAFNKLKSILVKENPGLDVSNMQEVVETATKLDKSELTPEMQSVVDELVRQNHPEMGEWHDPSL